VAGSEPLADGALGVPTPALRPFVARYAGYRYLGFPPGIHLGLPGRYLTVVLALGPPTRLDVLPDGRRSPTSFRALASGLSTRRVVIGHDGDQYGVQLDVTTRGARALFGLPAGELFDQVVDLSLLLGDDADELLDRMTAAPGWAGRFAALDDVLLRRLRPEPAAASVPSPLDAAWRAVVRRGPALRVDELAGEIGWSRRHLTERFTREFGLGPKELARVVRFERSKSLLQRGGYGSLAEVAARCGYYDQAHLAREWRQIAGCAPSAWLRSEDLPNVQAVAKDEAETLVS
jgi:AraC-like DNA-binding protein